jgi:hypothetical protein
MNNKELYSKLFLKDTPIFHKPFFLNAVAENQWDVALVFIHNELVASLPYVVSREKGYLNIQQAPFTQYLGPWFCKSYLVKDKIGKEKRLLDLLFEQLPPYSSYIQHWHYDISNWLPLYWKEYTQTTRYTYILSDLRDLKKVQQGFDSDVRRKLKSAAKKVNLVDTDNFEYFYNFLKVSFDGRQKQGLPDCNLFTRVNLACTQNNCRKILIAEGPEGIVGGVYLIWDAQSVYYMAGGYDVKYANIGVMQLLIWESIQFASSLNLKFDFEGSMIESIEHFFRSFGASQQPFFKVSKINSKKIIFAEGVKMLKKVFFNRT